jgi:hypothetical protein
MRETIRKGQRRWLDVGEAVLPDLTSLSLGGADVRQKFGQIRPATN